MLGRWGIARSSPIPLVWPTAATALLLTPYLAWTGFATALDIAVNDLG